MTLVEFVAQLTPLYDQEAEVWLVTTDALPAHGQGDTLLAALADFFNELDDLHDELETTPALGDDLMAVLALLRALEPGRRTHWPGGDESEDN